MPVPRSRRRFLLDLGAAAATAAALPASALAAREPPLLYPPTDLSHFDTPIGRRSAEIRFGYVAITWQGDDARAMDVAKKIRAAGFDVRGIRPPTVPKGTARLRISLTLNASPEDVDGLAAALANAL